MWLSLPHVRSALRPEDTGESGLTPTYTVWGRVGVRWIYLREFLSRMRAEDYVAGSELWRPTMATCITATWDWGPQRAFCGLT